ncbi:MAG: SHOCT domain-containing protein [Desulfobacterales bacterium]|nr:SHOCT domain-containing protein [Desulfobacterales bacterium]
MKLKKTDKEGLFKSIFTAYFILLLHVFLLAGVGLSVVLFKGVYHYLPWILGGLGLLVVGVAFLIYRRMRVNSDQIRDVLSVPEFRDRTVEVRLLGGLASFKINAPDPNAVAALPETPSVIRDNALLIESAVDRTEKKMLELNTLYEKELITEDEYKAARQQLIQG